jgi:hypothetical protein
MGRPRQFALVLLCVTVTGAGWCAARLGGFEWSGIETTARAIWHRAAARAATVSSIDAGRVAMAAVAAVRTSHRELSEAADPDPRETSFGLASISAVEAPAVDADSMPSTESNGRLVSLFRPEAPLEEPLQLPVRPIEIVDECLVVATCIDEYLWALYERTPKVDTNKVTKQIKTTVKTKKGKTRTVTKTTTDYVVADFAWKDPIAAGRAGLSVKEYVIGGMDRGFKLKLFRALRMMDDAGFMPGITSAFRDDYRQSIASGNKAASDSSFHGGSRRGGYGHGMAIDVVSVKGATRLQRFAVSEELWKWIDAHEMELGVGRPYLDRDPPHLAPVDGREFAAKRGRTIVRKTGPEKAPHQESTAKTERLSQARPARAMAGHPATPPAVYAQSAPRGW